MQIESGACMVAMAVALTLEKEDRDQMIEDVLSVEEYATKAQDSLRNTDFPYGV